MNEEIEITPLSGKIKCAKCKGTNIGWVQEKQSNPMMVCLDCEKKGLNK